MRDLFILWPLFVVDCDCICSRVGLSAFHKSNSLSIIPFCVFSRSSRPWSISVVAISLSIADDSLAGSRTHREQGFNFCGPNSLGMKPLDETVVCDLLLTT